MTGVLPFRGLRLLDPGGNAASVLAPPYDVLDETERDRFAALSPRNVVHLTLPRPAAGADPYRHAAGLLARWRAEGGARLDEEPAIYLQEARFRDAEGVERVRVGAVAAVEADPLGPGGIRPHEKTHADVVDDRYRLLAATRCDLEPVFLLHRRPADWVRQTLDGADVVEEATAEIAGVRWTLRTIRGEAARRLAEGISGSPLYVADGHHRSTVSAEARRRHPTEPGARWRTALLVAADDPGLLVLPTHRLLLAVDPDEVLRTARATLRLAETSESDLSRRLRQERDPRAFGLLAPGSGAWLALPTAPPDPDEGPLAALDVVLAERAVLEPLRRRGRPLSPPDVVYLRGAGDPVAAARERGARIALLLRPPPLATLLEVCDRGLLMPQKSTYFEPKALSGQALLPWDAPPLP